MIKDTSSQDVIISEPKHKKMVVKVTIFALIAITLSITAYPTINSWSSSDVSVNSSRVRFAEVQRGEFIRDISLQGNIVAANSPKLYAPAVGAVTLKSNPGTLVNQGDLVAIVSSPELTNRLQQEKAKLESLAIELQRHAIASKQINIKSRQQIQLEQVVLEAAKREKRRAEKSLKIQALSQLDYEKSIDELKRSQLKYDFAIEQAELEKENSAFELQTRKSELAQYELIVSNTQRLVESLNLIAPVSGIVGSWSVEQKSAVSLNQPLLTIVDLSAFQVEIEIPESYADAIGLDMPVKVQYNGEEYDASVVSISPEVINNIVKGRVAFAVEPPPGIKQNQKVSSRVILEKKNDVLYVPRGSFVQHHGGLKAFLVENNTASLIEIKLGARSLDKIEIISGLQQGQKIIISNTDFVDKAKVISIN